MENTQMITDGIHILSGVSDLIINADTEPWNLWSDSNGYIIVLDGKTYVVFEDPEDGYRSCGFIGYAKGEVCKNTFPEQRILVRHFDGTKRWSDWYTSKMWYYEFLNPDTEELILKIGTDEYDDYYPNAILEYHPENLPINSDKNIYR